MYEAVLGSRVAEIREFVLRPKFLLHPDELYFNVLAYNPHLGMPGACLDEQPIPERGYGYLGKFVLWVEYVMPCPTKYVRDVCIFGLPHITMLKQAPHLFANKFHADFHPEAYTYLEAWYFNRVSKERITGSYSKIDFDTSLYAKRLCSRRHLP